MTVSDKSHISSCQVSEQIAKNMKAHTLDESLILHDSQKIASTMLANKAAMKISKITV